MCRLKEISMCIIHLLLTIYNSWYYIINLEIVSGAAGFVLCANLSEVILIVFSNICLALPEKLFSK